MTTFDDVTPTTFWATAPGTEARRKEEALARELGTRDELRELKADALAMALGMLAGIVKAPDK